jgi:hypothetical protein
MFICLTICSSVLQSVWQSVHLLDSLFICLTVCSSFLQSVHLFDSLFICLTICSDAWQSVHLFDSLFICSSANLFICLSAGFPYPSVVCSFNLSILLSVPLSVHASISSSLCSTISWLSSSFPTVNLSVLSFSFQSFYHSFSLLVCFHGSFVYEADAFKISSILIYYHTEQNIYTENDWLDARIN